jgi:hypothetical protein
LVVGLGEDGGEHAGEAILRVVSGWEVGNASEGGERLGLVGEDGLVFGGHVGGEGLDKDSGSALFRSHAGPGGHGFKLGLSVESELELSDGLHGLGWLVVDLVALGDTQ